MGLGAILGIKDTAISKIGSCLHEIYILVGGKDNKQVSKYMKYVMYMCIHTCKFI